MPLGKENAGDFFNGRLQKRLRALPSINFRPLPRGTLPASYCPRRAVDDTFLPGKRGVVLCRGQTGQVLGPEWQALPLRLLSVFWPVPQAKSPSLAISSGPCGRAPPEGGHSPHLISPKAHQSSWLRCAGPRGRAPSQAGHSPTTTITTTTGTERTLTRLSFLER